MPLRPDMPTGSMLSRRTMAPVKLPKMTFPSLGGSFEAVHQTPTDGVEGSVPLPEEVNPVETSPAPAPVAASQPPAKVIIYGRSGSQACLEALQDLVDRQTCFTYHDIDRDAQAMQQLMLICGGAPVVPVIIQIGSTSS